MQILWPSGSSLENTRLSSFFPNCFPNFSPIVFPQLFSSLENKGLSNLVLLSAVPAGGIMVHLHDDDDDDHHHHHHHVVVALSSSRIRRSADGVRTSVPMLVVLVARLCQSWVGVAVSILFS